MSRVKKEKGGEIEGTLSGTASATGTHVIIVENIWCSLNGFNYRQNTFIFIRIYNQITNLQKHYTIPRCGGANKERQHTATPTSQRVDSGMHI